MSLNRSEQYLFDYITANKDEGQHWHAKVQAYFRKNVSLHDLVVPFESELWAYYVERAQGSPKFGQGMPTKDLRRTSMKNLAEHLLRLWGPPATKKKN